MKQARAQHTPGPWTFTAALWSARDGQTKTRVVSGPDGQPVGIVHDEPDARLIAQAPRMLQFTQDIARWLAGVSGPDAISPGNLADVLRDARAILRDVEGDA